jgi:hypothetical protein
MFWYFVLGAALLIILLQVSGYIRYRRLEWPTSLSYYAYRRYVIRTLRRFGWTVNQSTWVPFDFWAERSRNGFFVMLLPPGMDLSASKVKDICGIGPDVLKGRKIVCITASNSPAHLVEEAARGQVRIIWYKDLPTL